MGFLHGGGRESAVDYKECVTCGEEFKVIFSVDTECFPCRVARGKKFAEELDLESNPSYDVSDLTHG